MSKLSLSYEKHPTCTCGAGNVPFRSTWFHFWFLYMFMLFCHLCLLISCNCLFCWIL